jgi:hypothetical protein
MDGGTPGRHARVNAQVTASPLYPRPDGLDRSLRVLMVMPPSMPGWVAAFRRLAQAYEWLDVQALTVERTSVPSVSGVGADVRAFVALERSMLGAGRSLDPVTVDDAPMVSEADLQARVQAIAPDLVILFGAADGAQALASQAPWGCWLVDPALLDPRHAGLSLLAPMVRGETATQMALMLHPEARAPIDLATSWGRTRATAFQKQREDAFRKLPALLLRAVHRLASGYVPVTHHAVATLRLGQQPASGKAVGLRGLASTVRASPNWLMGWRRNGRVGWTLVLRLGGTSLDPEAPHIGTHALLKAPRGWWGDPFVVSAQGRRLIFVEEMADPRSHKANIACVELVSGGARRLGTVLDESGHLSFPQVFEWDGQWYMTVESGYDRRVSLYRAVDFPMQWVRLQDLVTGWVCVDPTLHHHEGHWYLFANIAENGNNTCDELFLFVADRLEGPYRPHPASPIVCDVRRARMAGRLFQHRGRLIRPAQDCGPGYGNAVMFNEVTSLGPTVYCERPLSRLAPFLTRHVDGCHTYNADGGVEVLDVLGRPPSGIAYLQVLDDGGTDQADPRDPFGRRLATPGSPVHPVPPPR